MDLTRTVAYRNYALNTIKFDALTRDMVGCEIAAVEYSAVEGIGYDEKRALSEGTDTSDITFNKRFIAMRGNVYGRTRAEAFTEKRRLLDILSPQDAYGSAKSQHGFWPLDFYEPTTLTSYFPNGLIHHILFARPAATPSIRFEADDHGGYDSGALAIPWSARLECRDPRLYSYDWRTVVTSVASTSGSGNFINRGNRSTPIHIVLQVPPYWNGTNNDATHRGSFAVSYGGTKVIIKPYNVSYQQTYEYNSHDKVLERRTSAITELRMDGLAFGSPLQTHADLQQGTTAYSWTRPGSSKRLLAGSYIRFRDAWS